MSATDVITFAGIAVLVIATQIGRRPLSLRRFVLPLAAVAFVGQQYLHNIPTAGGDLDFEIALATAGALFGVLAGVLMRVERDTRTGKIMTQAGLAYIAVWVIVFGGRLAFAWGATHLWSHQIGQFSMQHAITGSAAWTAAFVLMALTMVATRTLVVAGKALMTSDLRPSPSRA